MSDEERSSSAESSSEEEVSDQEASDVEDQVKGEDDEPKTPVVKTGPSEAELAMKKRRMAQISCSADLDEAAKEMLEANIEERAKLEDEIEEMKKKSEQRRKERQAEERRATEKRVEDESRRKGEEEERKRKKEEEEKARKEARATKMAEFEKLKNPQKRNFVISGRKPETTTTSEDPDDTQEEKKTREQLEAEKKVAMAQRISPLAIEGLDSSRLIDRAKELRAIIIRLESEKYDLEKQFKEQQYDMLELAERARSINQVGKGGLKRITEGDDKIQERFAGAPAKIVMYSQFERQKDKRSYVERYDQFTGATYLFPAIRIVPTKSLSWSEDGLPSYIEMPETNGVQEDAAQPVTVE